MITVSVMQIYTQCANERILKTGQYLRSYEKNSVVFLWPPCYINIVLDEWSTVMQSLMLYREQRGRSVWWRHAASQVYSLPLYL